VTIARQRTGRAAEALVVSLLIGECWEIVERNARTRHGELDVVALEGRELVFVEVKAGRTSSGRGPERPVLSVGAAKQRRIRRLAAAWMAERCGRLPRFDGIRFDAVGVLFDRDGEVADLEHIRDAF
jgi:putative endonuclease